MYQIDPAAYGSVFVLPKRLVETDLLLASGNLLKVLLFAFANAGAELSAETCAAGTGLPAAEAADALLYWQKKGYLKEDTPAPEAAAEPEAAADAAAPQKETKAAVSLKPSKPSYETICTRMEEEPLVRALFNEAQLKLGRTIGTADQASLLLLYDYYGLPIEVILAICEYARIHKKERNMGYIYSVGVDWSKREIDTLEAADEELQRLESVNTRWVEFARRTGIPGSRPTAAQQKFLAVWLDEWHFSYEMLSLAFDEMRKNTDKTSFPYMNKILATWRQEGVDTPEKAADRERRHQEDLIRRAAEKAAPKAAAAAAPKKKNSTDTAGPASYDIEKAIHKMNTTVPKLNKKEKR